MTTLYIYVNLLNAFVLVMTVAVPFRLRYQVAYWRRLKPVAISVIG
jgi:hypothetical protein